MFCYTEIDEASDSKMDEGITIGSGSFGTVYSGKFKGKPAAFKKSHPFSFVED